MELQLKQAISAKPSTEIFELLLPEDAVPWVGRDEEDDANVDGLPLMTLKCERNIASTCSE